MPAPPRRHGLRVGRVTGVCRNAVRSVALKGFGCQGPSASTASRVLVARSRLVAATRGGRAWVGLAVDPTNAASYVPTARVRGVVDDYRAEARAGGSEGPGTALAQSLASSPFEAARYE